MKQKKISHRSGFTTWQKGLVLFILGFPLLCFLVFWLGNL